MTFLLHVSSSPFYGVKFEGLISIVHDMVVATHFLYFTCSYESGLSFYLIK